MVLKFGVFFSTKHYDKIHERAMRYFLGVHSLTPLPALYGEMGWAAVKFRHHINIIRFWNRLVALPTYRLTKYIFERDIALSQKSNWSYRVKNILDMYQCKTEFTNRSKCNISCVKIVADELSETFWRTEMSKKTKLRTYQLIKRNLIVSDYVNALLPKYKRSLMTQFVSGILPLRIETGRFKKVKDTSSGNMRTLYSHERLCEMCTLGEPEDEIHFLCTCELYLNYRDILFRSAIEENTNFILYNKTEQFVWLVTNMWKHVITFLVHAWELRKAKLYVI